MAFAPCTLSTREFQCGEIDKEHPAMGLPLVEADRRLLTFGYANPDLLSTITAQRAVYKYDDGTWRERERELYTGVCCSYKKHWPSVEMTYARQENEKTISHY